MELLWVLALVCGALAGYCGFLLRGAPVCPSSRPSSSGPSSSVKAVAMQPCAGGRQLCRPLDAPPPLRKKVATLSKQADRSDSLLFSGEFRCSAMPNLT